MDYGRYFEMPLAFVQTFSKSIPKLSQYVGQVEVQVSPLKW